MSTSQPVTPSPIVLDYEDKGLRQIQLASGLILVVTAIAIAIIALKSPDILRAVSTVTVQSHAFPFIVTTATVAGISLIAFVTATVLRCRLPKIEEATPEASAAPVEEVDSDYESDAEVDEKTAVLTPATPRAAAPSEAKSPQKVVCHTLTKDNLEAVVLNKLFPAVEGLFVAMIRACGRCMRTELASINKTLGSVHTGISELKALCLDFLTDGKKALSVLVKNLIGPYELALKIQKQRVIACAMSGKVAEGEELLKAYQLMEKTNGLPEVALFLKSGNTIDQKFLEGLIDTIFDSYGANLPDAFRDSAQQLREKLKEVPVAKVAGKLKALVELACKDEHFRTVLKEVLSDLVAHIEDAEGLFTSFLNAFLGHVILEKLRPALRLTTKTMDQFGVILTRYAPAAELDKLDQVAYSASVSDLTDVASVAEKQLKEKKFSFEVSADPTISAFQEKVATATGGSVKTVDDKKVIEIPHEFEPHPLRTLKEMLEPAKDGTVLNALKRGALWLGKTVISFDSLKDGGLAFAKKLIEKHEVSFSFDQAVHERRLKDLNTALDHILAGIVPMIYYAALDKKDNPFMPIFKTQITSHVPLFNREINAFLAKHQSGQIDWNELLDMFVKHYGKIANAFNNVHASRRLT